MDLLELKNAILDEKIPNKLMVFLCKADPKDEDKYAGSKYLAHHYIDAICKVSYKSKNIISSIYDTRDSMKSLIFSFESYINVLYVDEFNEEARDYSKFTDTIIVCTAINKKITDKVKDYVVEIDAAEPWQLSRYVKTICPELSQESIDWLVSNYPNVYNLLNEVDKITVYDTKDRQGAFNYYFKDLEVLNKSIPIYILVDAICTRDIDKLKECLRYRYTSDFDSMPLIVQLINKYKGFLTTRYILHAAEENAKIRPGYNKSASAWDKTNKAIIEATRIEMLPAFGFDNKKFWAAYYNFTKEISIGLDKNGKQKTKRIDTITEAYATKILSFLTKLYAKLKDGELDIGYEQKIDYVISQLLAL